MDVYMGALTDEVMALKLIILNRNQIFSLHSLYYAVACNEFCGAHVRDIAPGQHSSFRGNVAAVANCWQHCVRFDRPRFEPQTSRSRDERVTLEFRYSHSRVTAVTVSLSRYRFGT